MKTDILTKLAEQDSELKDKLLGILARHESRTKREPKVEARMYYDIPTLPNTYQGLEPGTDIWLQYWSAHPEQQQEMLNYRKQR